MIKYILKRLLWMIPVILGVLFIVFTISYFTPGDPVVALLGSNYTQEAYDRKVIELGLDKPFVVQFISYVWGIVTRLDFGVSYSYGHLVGVEMSSRLGTTFTLGMLSVCVTILLGIPFGLLSATKQYSLLDYGVTSLSMIFAAMPGYWLALMCILLFALKLEWLPATGLGSWRHWVLPVLSNSLTSVAVVARMTRSSMLEVIRQDYIRTARAKGLKESKVISRHALKNALIPVITIVGMQMSMVMGGSVIIETIFTIPGLGTYLMSGISARDYPVINGCVLLLSLCICAMNLLVDVCYAYVDPRIKAQYESGKKRGQAKKEAA
ncbi:MAG: ABC transporter permease [Oscillospiraceae bacterium]